MKIKKVSKLSLKSWCYEKEKQKVLFLKMFEIRIYTNTIVKQRDYFRSKFFLSILASKNANAPQNEKLD